MKNQAGQITIEAVLVLTILFSTIFAGTRLMQERQLLTKLVQGPWTYLAGMIENGYWSPPANGKNVHPNQIVRHGSPEGERPQ